MDEYEVTMKVAYPGRVPTYRSVVIDNAEDASTAARRALVALNERLLSVEWKAGGGHEVSVTEVRGVRTVNGAVVEYLSLHQPDKEGK